MSVSGTYFLYYFIVISTSVTVFISEFLGYSKTQKTSKFIFGLAIIIPVIIAGYRFGVGTDYFSYEKIYYNLTNNYLNVFELISNYRYEPGWILLNVFVKYVFNDVKYVFIVSALLTWSIFFKAIYNQRNYISTSIAVLILLCTLFNISLNTVRQTLALSIIFLSITPLLNRSLFRFIIYVLLASCFHYTSLIFLPVYWIVNSKGQKIGLLKKSVAPLIFVLFIVFIDPILSLVSSFDLFSAYASYDVEGENFSFGALILRLPVILIVLLHIRKLRIKSNPITKIVILYFLGIILLHLGYFGPYIGRVAQFFEISQVLLIGAIIKEMDNKTERLLYSYAIIIYYLGWLTYHYLYLGRQGTIPYDWMF